jgi:hypothetical protein
MELNKKTAAGYALKKTIVGYALIISGITALTCTLLFVFLGSDLNSKTEIEFEEEQSYNLSAAQTDSISVPGFETWTIDAGKTKASTNFYNPEKNTCYFVISVVLDDTGETIYESKYIKPGQHLYEVELLEALNEGTYRATLHYSTYSMTDLTPLNGADVPFELVVN